MSSYNMVMTVKEYLSSPDVLPRLRFLSGLILVLLLAKSGASLTWKIADSFSASGIESAAGTRPVSKRTSRNTPAAGRIAPSQAEELPLFGVAARGEETDRSLPADSAAVPETTLALVLKGIVKIAPQDRALAVIAEKGKEDQEELYGVGDTVPGNAVISEIYADRVLLRRGGVFETLMMQFGETEGLSRNNTAVAAVASGEEAIIDMGDGVHWEVDNDYLEQRLNDIPSLAREVGVEVYKEGDVQAGYRLISARGSKLLRELGLQPGDVLYEVNGIKLDTIQGGLSAYQKIREGNEIRVVIGRNGRRETRIYQVNNGG